MTNGDSILTGHGERMLEDQAVCVAVGTLLAREFPGFDFMVGCDHNAGTVVIDIMCDKPIGLANHGYLLHLSSVLGSEGQRKVRNAGGELLERLGLRRDRADAEWRQQAREHGLHTGGAVLKSRH